MDDDDTILDDITDDTTEYSIKARLKPEKLLANQRSLNEEKNLLQSILTKIDCQVHALQVEQLHLLSLVNKSLKDKDKNTTSTKPKDNIKTNESTERKLDLSVPAYFNNFEEELDDEEDEI